MEGDIIWAVSKVPVWLGDRNARGKLTRMMGAWVLVGVPVIAARVVWSAPAAIGVFLVTLIAYVTCADLYVARRGRQS